MTTTELATNKMKLTEGLLQSNFGVAKIFRENTSAINSLDFTLNGDNLITGSAGDEIIIYNCREGTQKRVLHSKKYGVEMIKYTHGHDSVIHSSNKLDHSIRYLSLHDNKYIRYFTGHQKKVTSLAMSPTDDAILSASQDATVRLWDLRSLSCQGQLTTTGQPVANFDPEGLIFAVGINSDTIKLYDRRNFDKGAFSAFKKQPDPSLCNWTDLKFSPDSKSFLISTDGGLIHMLDSFKGHLVNTFTGHANSKGLPLEACFSPDSQFVFCGSTDGKVHCWNASTGALVMSYTTEHQTPIMCTKFNPKYFMLATAAQNLAFWIPSVTED